jgi:hypothetical protein
MEQLHHRVRQLSYLSPAMELFSVDLQAMFEHNNLYVHEVLDKIAYKWFVVHAISIP